MHDKMLASLFARQRKRPLTELPFQGGLEKLGKGGAVEKNGRRFS
jgi:hypothetical protein